LQINSLRSDSQITLILRGQAESLEALKDILETEVRKRAAKFYYQQDPNDDWSFKRLSDLQELLPRGINLAMFARDGEQIPREILGQITFAPNFEFPRENS
jgi:hypothetical protein